MELLLTGSTGFVGRNLLLKLLRDDRWRRIFLPVRDPHKLQAQLAGEGIEVGGLGDRLKMMRVSGEAWELPAEVCPDLVIHAAGKLFGREREEYFQTNVEGSRNLVSQLPENARMIVLSSLAAGGPTPSNVEARSMDHDDEPISFYGASKLAMEKVLRDQLGARLLILRPPMVLGPRDTATEPLFQMAKGMARVKPGFQPKHYSWIAVDDLCAALCTATTTPWPALQRPLYLTGCEVITDVQLLTTAAAVIPARGFTLPVPQSAIQLISLILDAVPSWREAVPSLSRDRVREIMPDRWVCDGSEFAKAFEWTPCRRLEETLQATCDWLKINHAFS